MRRSGRVCVENVRLTFGYWLTMSSRCCGGDIEFTGKLHMHTPFGSKILRNQFPLLALSKQNTPTSN